MRRIDLTGKRFGRWSVVSFYGLKSRRNGYWNCICDCGTKKQVYSGSLKRGDSTSCGCYRTEITKSNLKYNIEIGDRFERLTVIFLDGAVIKCLCDCGEKVTAKNVDLLRGAVKSCGCLRDEKFRAYVNSVIQKSKENAKSNIGKRFGRWVVIGYGGSDLWLCRCVCGKESRVKISTLKGGGSKSCGCLAIEQTRKRTALYDVEKHPVGYRYPHSEKLSDSYVRMRLKTIGRIYVSSIKTTPEMIELKREQLELTRLIRKGKEISDGIIRNGNKRTEANVS